MVFRRECETKETQIALPPMQDYSHQVVAMASVGYLA